MACLCTVLATPSQNFCLRKWTATTLSMGTPGKCITPPVKNIASFVIAMILYVTLCYKQSKRWKMRRGTIGYKISHFMAVWLCKEGCKVGLRFHWGWGWYTVLGSCTVSVSSELCLQLIYDWTLHIIVIVKQRSFIDHLPCKWSLMSCVVLGHVNIIFLLKNSDEFCRRFLVSLEFLI